ncbi:MAG: F-type H+-transporting ATPase subunit delta [Candidatus Omnitrophota bacterium]|jgi:F-type H+-transporting ATPase subunit delta
METSAAAERYARALFDQAQEEHALASIREDMLALTGLIRDNADFAAFVADPTIPEGKRADSLDALFAGKAHPMTLRFLKLLNMKGRFGELAVVGQVFENMVCDQLGILKVKITAAHDLSLEQLDKLKAKLGARHGKEIQAEVETDPSLVGGFKIQVGDHISDHSIATKLDKFKQRVINA